MTESRQSYSAVIACGPASARRYLPGREENCTYCGARIFVSDETRSAAAAAHGDGLAFGCVPCVLDFNPGDAVEVSPLGRRVAAAAAVTHWRGRRIE